MRGHPKWDLVNLPTPIQPVSLHQYRILGSEEEIQKSIAALQQAGIVQTALSPFNSPIWPVKKTDGTWRMTVDYHALNWVTLELTAIVPDIVTLVERITTAAQLWHMVIDLANTFFSIDIHPDSQNQFAFTWQAWQYKFTMLPQGYKHSPTVFHLLVLKC